MTRREFARTALAAAGSSSLAQPPPPKSKTTSSVMLWTLSGSFEDRVRTAANAGMQSVELVGEYAGWPDAELRSKRRFLQSFGLSADALSANPNWTTRPVSMVDPAQRDAFLADVRTAIAVAQKLEARYLILMSGDTIRGRSQEDQYASVLEGSKRAADYAAAAGLTLIFEPLNSRVDHKGYFLPACSDGLKLVRAVDNPHVRLLFDLYHEQVQTGTVLNLAVEAAPWVAVYHVADAPGRHDPGTGKMDYPKLYSAIAKTGFAGYVAMEYLPVGDPVSSLIQSVDAMRAAFTNPV